MAFEAITKTFYGLSLMEFTKSHISYSCRKQKIILQNLGIWLILIVDLSHLVLEGKYFGISNQT